MWHPFHKYVLEKISEIAANRIEQGSVMILDFLLVERDRNVPPIGLCSIDNYCEISPMTDSRGFPTPTEKL